LRFIDEFRDAEAAGRYADRIREITTRPWTIMEICGGQTHAIVKFGIDRLMPPEIELLHGPGCPVCVTPLEIIEKALDLAGRSEIVFCSFGDMLRVPGVNRDLLSVKAEGADVRMVYSPLDAVRIAEEEPDREVVFLAVGFETTAPANALAVLRASRKNLPNFSMLVSHVLVPPAIEAILESPGNRIDGFLAAGHVCAVMGFSEYEPIAERFKVPIVVTGFEPLDILQGVAMCVAQLEAGSAGVQNQYVRAVRRPGNLPARELMTQVFEVVPRRWRGLGDIPRSGLGLRSEFARFDAEVRFGLRSKRVAEPIECRSGDVLTGKLKPKDCPSFGTLCTPDRPLGAPMVSNEGACSAYFRYRKAAENEGC